jgi:hypothetical protein
LIHDHSPLDAIDDIDGVTPSIFSTFSTNGLADPAVAGDRGFELPAATLSIDERELPS